MRRYLAALSSLILIQPAAALDLGGGVKSGGVSVGASIGASTNGVSVGIAAGGAGDGVSGAASVSKDSTGASVGKDKAGISASVNGGGNLGGVSVGASGKSNLGGVSGVSADATSGISSAVGETSNASPSSKSPTSAANSKDQAAATTTAISRAVIANGFDQVLTLPRSLRPAGGRSGRANADAMKAVAGTPTQIVSACRQAIENAASDFGAVSVQARSAGTLRQLTGDILSAPVQVRIRYARSGGPEIRQARIKCQLDASGKVIKLI